MLFEMSNSLETFLKVRVKAFRPFLEKFVKIYLNDFFVYGKMDHIQQLRLTFECLTKFHYSLSPKKCKFKDSSRHY